MYANQTKQAGFSFVEIIIVSAISALIFGALFSSFKYTLALISDGKAKLSALSIANDRMEYFRSLPYDAVGTISGIPPGTIPQNSTTTLNGIVFSERVLVEYVDDPADGKDTATTSDNNGIPSDYKRVKVEYSWNIGNGDKKISLISNIVPRSVETTSGGGTVRINVLDADSSLLSGATVRLINNTTTSTIDVTKTTDVSGTALFSGAPAGSDYQVSVTANIGGKQYSTAGTYQATTTNPNPSVAPFAVLEADVSTMTFQIGELSDLTVHTYSSVLEGSVLEEFNDLNSVSSSTDIEIDNGSAVIASNAGTYKNQGIVYTQIVNPTPLLKWETLRVSAKTPVNTDYVVRFYTGSGSGPFTLIPDADLPGNSVGFVDTLIDITALDPTTYPALTVGVTLNTANNSFTPEIDELEIFYTQSQTQRSAVNNDIHGTKTIGTDASSSPIYKYDTSFTTDAAGQHIISNLEFDSYTIANQSGLDVANVCPSHQLIHQAGKDSEIEFTLVPDASHTLRVQVLDMAGRMIPGATVTLSRSGFNQTVYSNVCGQAFFTGGITSNTDYTLDVSVSGYVNQVLNPFEVSGDTFELITLTI